LRRRLLRITDLRAKERDGMTPAERPELHEKTPSPEGSALASWLTLIGWQVEIDQESGLYVAVAHHVTASGDRLSVGACGGTRVEVVWQLFESAMGKLGAADKGAALRSRRHSVAA
jgi:hypothetical protein